MSKEAMIREDMRLVFPYEARGWEMSKRYKWAKGL